MKRLMLPACVVMLLLLPDPSTGQVTANGEAFGTDVSLLGVPIEPLRQGGTGPQSATEDTATESFSVTGTGGVLPDNPLAQVVANSSMTEGLASGTDSFVSSLAGHATVTVLPGSTSPLSVVASGATSQVDCSSSFASSGIDALEIAGMAVPIPGSAPPNTAISVPGVADVILNRQQLVIDPGTGTAELTVDALFAAVIPDGNVVEVTVSSAFAGLENLPADCPILEGPVLTNSFKNGELIRDLDEEGVAEAGDRVLYTVHAENLGPEPTGEITITDRLPTEVTVDESTVLLDGEPADFTIGPCTESFAFCPEESSASCLTVPIGVLELGESIDLTFEADLNDDQSGDVCNTALIGETERVHLLDGDEGGISDNPSLGPGGLVTTGTGGCSTLPASERNGVWLSFLALGLLAARRRRTRPAE